MRMGKSVKLKTYKLMEIAKFKGVKLQVQSELKAPSHLFSRYNQAAIFRIASLSGCIACLLFATMLLNFMFPQVIVVASFKENFTTHRPPAEILCSGLLIDVAPFPRLPFLGKASAFPTINLNAPLCIVWRKCENARWPNRWVCSHKTG